MKEILVAKAIAGFQAAAIDGLPWMEAVEHLAAATRSRSGELIGLGAKCAVPFNLMSGADPMAGEAFIAAGGGDPAVNSRVRVGARSAELEIRDEADFTTDSDMRRNLAYADWVRTYDMAQICLTTLLKDDGLLVGMAIMRGRRDDQIDSEAKRAFTAIAPHARRAVRTRFALENSKITWLLSGLDAARATAFVCEADGRVRAMTASAEALAASGKILIVRRGRLVAASDRDQAALDHLITSACAGGAGDVRPLALRSAGGDDVRLAEASPLPAPHPLSTGATALLIVRQPPADQVRIASAAAACYGLSPAEAAIAASLALGRTVTAIAAERQVSVGTVRSQVRGVFTKTGAANQLELASRLVGFG